MSDHGERALSREQLELVDRLTAELIDRPKPELADALLEHCPDDSAVREEVRSILGRVGSGPLIDLDQPVLPNEGLDALGDAPAEPGPAARRPPDLPSSIGPYRILDLLGEGGFGMVLLAEQTAPLKRRVALKVIKPGMDSHEVLARFEAERQALALMDHPFVARVFDAGITSAEQGGRPFFVMEHVQGLPITTHCDRHKLGIRARIELIMDVCAAVQHAHQKGIIHRDLKPSNILVSDRDGRPTPRVIDFGVAKALHGRLTGQTVYTGFGQMVGTPEYMSPEQAEMTNEDVDTRADVYSIGVLLYELLTGARPFESDALRRGGLAEIQRVIREVDPPRPSTRLGSISEAPPGADRALKIAQQRSTQLRTLTSVLRRDLDWVVMRCLEKDRSRRYETASALAADLGRYLRNEPVSAGPPTAGYRLTKFVRRHRTGLAAGGVVAAALVGATVFSGLAAADASRARDRESDRADDLEAVTAFQESRLRGVDPERMGSEIRSRLLSDYRAALTSDPEVTDHSSLIEGFEKALGSTNFTDLSLGALRAQIFAPAIDSVRTDFSERPLLRARLLVTLSETLAQLGLFQESAPPLTEALSIYRTRLGDSHAITLHAVNTMGTRLEQLGDADGAEAHYREAVTGLERLLGRDHPDTLAALDNLGSNLEARGALDAAEQIIREVLSRRRRALGPDHPDTITSIGRLANVFASMGEHERAEDLFRQAYESRRRALGEDHADTLIAMNKVGYILNLQGRLEEAAHFYAGSLDRQRRALGDDHRDTLVSITNLASLRREQGRLADSEALLREGVDRSRRVLGADHPDTLVQIGNLATILKDRGDLAGAEALFSELVEDLPRVFGAEHPRTLTYLGTFGSLLRVQGRVEEAEPYYRTVLEARTRLLGSDHPSTLSAMSGMAALLRSAGKLSDAESLYREAWRGRSVALGSDHSRTLTSKTGLGLVLMELGSLDEAHQLLDEVHQDCARVLGPDHPKTIAAVANVGLVLAAKAELAAAEEAMREALRDRLAVLGEDHPDTLDSLFALASVLVRVESFVEAETLALRCESGRRDALGSGHPATRQAIELLIELYTDWHDIDPENGHGSDAALWREKLSG